VKLPLVIGSKAQSSSNPMGIEQLLLDNATKKGIEKEIS
jgi:hypothetical protein